MRQYTVLVVGQSAALRQNIKFILSQQRFHIVDAVDIETGVLNIEEQPVSLLILDELISPSAAVHFMRDIRKPPEYRSVPVLMLRDENSTIWDSDESGFSFPEKGRIITDDYDFYYLTKPFSTQALNTMIKRIFRETYSTKSIVS